MGPAGTPRSAVPAPGGRADAGPGRFPCQGKCNGRGPVFGPLSGAPPGFVFLLFRYLSIYLSIYLYCSTAWAMSQGLRHTSAAGTRSTPRNASSPLGTDPSDASIAHLPPSRSMG